VKGAGFDKTQRRYTCEWRNAFFRKRSELALPVDSTRLVCYTPNVVEYKDAYATNIFMDGEMALTTFCNFTLFVDDTEIVRDPPYLSINGSFMFR